MQQNTQHPQDELQVEVFRAGDYGSRGVYTTEDLEAIAADYNPRDHEAPVTLDHEQRGPAHGWVSAVGRVGDRLVATLSRLSPTLVESLRSRAFCKRSIELYRRFAGTGRPYLKAVSFLGAAGPAVKGLADPLFGDDDAALADVLRFDEELPSPGGADRARARLVTAGRWNPAWEAAGLPAVFDALGESPAADTLIQFLESTTEPVQRGAMAVHADPITSAFAEDVVGGASIQSAGRHAAAVELMRANPGLAYRDALLRLR